MAKSSALLFGIIFILAGILGFFMNPVLGFITAGALSNIIHIVVGIILLAVASKPSAAKALKTVGIVYVIFAILGFFQGTTILFGAFATSGATNWFYLVVGIVIAVLGFSSSKKGMSAPAAPMSSNAPQM